MQRPITLAWFLLYGCVTPPDYIGISVSAPTGSHAISSDGLVASYDMSSLTTAGSLQDFGPHGLHGQVAELSRVDGVFGGALRFDEVSYRIALPNDKRLEQPGPVTMAAWIRVDQLDHHQHIFACDDTWALWVTPTNSFRLGDTRGSGFNSREGSIRPGEWQSVVAVLQGTRGDSMNTHTVQMYVDGQPALGDHGAVWDSAELYPTDACYLGFESHQGNAVHQTLPFYGAIDEIMVFSRALTAEEAAAHARRVQ